MILVVKPKKNRRNLFLQLRRRHICVLSVFFFMLISGCDYGPEIIEISGKKFGTTYRLTIVADQPAPADLSEMIDSELNKIDVSMSTYKSSSEINQFNRLKANISFNMPVNSKVAKAPFNIINALSCHSIPTHNQPIVPVKLKYRSNI